MNVTFYDRLYMLKHRAMRIVHYIGAHHNVTLIADEVGVQVDAGKPRY